MKAADSKETIDNKNKTKTHQLTSDATPKWPPLATEAKRELARKIKQHLFHLNSVKKNSNIGRNQFQVQHQIRFTRTKKTLGKTQ